MAGRARPARNKAKESQYRHSEKGMMARKFYMMKPEVKLRMSIRRAIKRHMAGG